MPFLMEFWGEKHIKFTFEKEILLLSHSHPVICIQMLSLLVGANE